MSEVAAVAEVPAAPPPVVPAEVVADGQKPIEGSAPETQPEAKPETGDEEKRGTRRFERRISAAIRRAAEARAEADHLKRQIEELKQTSKPASDPNEPKLESYSDIEEYAKAKAEYATRQAKQKDEAERSSQAQKKFYEDLTASWEEKVEKFEAEDFETVVGELKPVNALIVAIMDEDNGPQVAYHLAKNPEEAQRIAGLTPLRQAKEIARLAAKLASEPAKPKTPSKAPAPIAPVTGTSAASSSEPSDADDMKTFIKKRNKQLGRS